MELIDPPKPTTWQTDSLKSEPSSLKPSAASLKIAERITRKMLSAFPDYGKSPPEYLLTITELMASYPEHIQLQIGNVKTGLPSKESFLPPAQKITDMAKALMDEEALFIKYAGVRKRFDFKALESGLPRAKYHCPFPKLEAALAAEGETDLLINKNFDELWFASRTHATEGLENAKEMLRHH